jgi:hypothetical protein
MWTVGLVASVRAGNSILGDADLTKFEFNKHMVQHQFCSTCGIQSFAIGTHPKTGAKLAAINVRCVDGVDVDALKVKKVDGRSL